MKRLFLHLSLGVAVTLLALSLTSALHAQQADQDPSPTAPQTNPAAQQPQQNEAQMPASGATTTEEAKAFSGRIVKENGELVLKDLVTKVSYKLSDQTKAKQYVGKDVKATGKLDMNTNTIQVESIEPIS